MSPDILGAPPEEIRAALRKAARTFISDFANIVRIGQATGEFVDDADIEPVNPEPIDVTGRRALAVTRGEQPALRRHVGEPQGAGGGIEVVAEETVAGRLSPRRRGHGLGLTEPRPLDDVDVEIAIAVEVRQCGPGPHHLDEVELSGHAVPVDEVKALVGPDLVEEGLGQGGCPTEQKKTEAGPAEDGSEGTATMSDRAHGNPRR